MLRAKLPLLLAAFLLIACAQTGSGFYRSDLKDDLVAQVQRGQSEQDVTALLGTPYRHMRFDKLQSTAWDYRYRDTWGYWVEYSVLFADNKRVTGTFSKRIDPLDRE